MHTRTTLVLAAVAVVVLAAGVYFGVGGGERQADMPAPQPAFPGLAPKLADAAAIEIAAAGKTLHLSRKGDAWTLQDKGGYPAQASHVHELLTGLAELKLDEPRTANADEYARLGVQDPPKEAPKDKKDDDAQASGTLVRVLDASGGGIAQILLGKTHTGSGGNGDGIYVRRPGEAQAWLAEGHLSAETDPADWIDKDIASIPADKIASVTVTRGDKTLTFNKKDGKLVLDMPGEPPKLDQYKVDDIGRALANLTLDDVQPAPPPFAEEGHSEFKTTDGMTIAVTVSKDPAKKEDADIWATFAVSGDDKAKTAADALQATVKGWAYKLGSWKETALVPTLDDLKAYVPPPPAAKPGAPAAATGAPPAPEAAPPAPAPATPPAPAEPAPAAK